VYTYFQQTFPLTYFGKNVEGILIADKFNTYRLSLCLCLNTIT